MDGKPKTTKKKNLLSNNFKLEPFDNQKYYFLRQFSKHFFQNHKIVGFLRHKKITTTSYQFSH